MSSTSKIKILTGNSILDLESKVNEFISKVNTLISTSSPSKYDGTWFLSVTYIPSAETKTVVKEVPKETKVTSIESAKKETPKKPTTRKRRTVKEKAA